MGERGVITPVIVYKDLMEIPRCKDPPLEAGSYFSQPWEHQGEKGPVSPRLAQALVGSGHRCGQTPVAARVTPCLPETLASSGQSPAQDMLDSVRARLPPGLRLGL